MSRDFVAPAHPSQRPVRRRATVRVLVLDDQDRLLLFRDSDPGTGAAWWSTPGGGIDPGESLLDAVRRELAEETGLQVEADQVVGPVAVRRVWHGYSDVVVDQHDTFFGVRVPAFEVDTSGFTAEEQVTVRGSRWWTPSDLATTTEVIWPARVVDLVALLASSEQWPLELPEGEESTVPLDAGATRG